MKLNYELVSHKELTETEKIMDVSISVLLNLRLAVEYLSSES